MASEYDKVLVDKDFPVLPDTTVASNKEFLYVLTSSKVSSIQDIVKIEYNAILSMKKITSITNDVPVIGLIHNGFESVNQ